MKPAAKKKKRNRVSAFPGAYQETRFTLYRLFSSIGLLIIAGFVFMLAAQQLQQYRLAEELKDYRHALEYQQQRKDLLNLEIERLHDPDYLEVQARTRLGLVKPGEIIFQLEE